MRRHGLRSLFAFALSIFLALGGVACACPGFLNKNCALTVVLDLKDPQAFNEGRATQISVVIVPESRSGAYKVHTNKQWFEGNRNVEDARWVDLEVSAERVREIGVDDVARNERLKRDSIRVSIANNGRRVEIKFRDLQDPTAGGYSNVAIYSQLKDNYEGEPKQFAFEDLRARGWRLQIGLEQRGLVASR